MLLTGYSDLAAIVGSINEGEVYRFVSKPWNNQEIVGIVAEAAAIGVALAETRTAHGLVSRTEATILVLSDAQEIYRAARELLADVCPVAYARDLDEALQVMREVEVAVLVADLDMPGADIASFLKLLKSEHPEILSIVITQASDSDSIIELINQAQMFRFLNKPVNLALMKSHALAALSRYQAFKADPQLLQQQLRICLVALNRGRAVVEDRLQADQLKIGSWMQRIRGHKALYIFTGCRIVAFLLCPGRNGHRRARDPIPLRPNAPAG